MTVTSLLAAVVVVAVLLSDRPGPFTVWQFERANANADMTGPVTLLWSIEIYSDTLSVEGPPGAAAPSALRITASDGNATPPSSMRTLDPAVNISVCPGRRPPKGASWWSGAVPPDMAADLRLRGATQYRIEVLVRSEWRSVRLIDSGCRGVGRA